MATCSQLITVLSRHIGRGNGISGKDLADALGVEQRHLRTMITTAIEEGQIAICGHPTTGYFIAATAQELIETIEFHDNRAKHELNKKARLSKMLADLFGQEHLPT
jgi:DNA-binding MarR family transcriptional regulator